MPNHCSNDMFVIGPKEQVDAFVKFVKGVDKFNKDETTPLDFNSILPYPERFNVLDMAALEHEQKYGWQSRPADGFNNGGYEWCIANWGTKWNAYDVELDYNQEDYEDGEISTAKYKFDTAWSPPNPVFTKWVEKFPELKFQLMSYESGNAFFQIMIGVDGQITVNNSFDYYGPRGG